MSVFDTNGTLQNSFFAFNPLFTGGVSVALESAPPTPTPMPEPSLLLLFGTGLATLVKVGRGPPKKTPRLK